MRKNTMQVSPPHRSLRSILLILITGLTLTACSDLVSDAAMEPSPDRPTSESKLRHAHLMDRAVRNAGKSGSTVGLIVGVENAAVDLYSVFRQYSVFRKYEYEHVFYGLAGEIEASRLDSVLTAMSADPDIAWVEPDIFVSDEQQVTNLLSGSEQGVPWGIERIGATQSTAVSGDGAGRVEGVELYVFDTGVYPADLRLTSQQDYTGSTTLNDEDGHGTHIAGTAAAEDDTDGVVGVAPGASVHGIKILDPEGGTTIADLVAGLEQMVGKKIENPNVPMVANLSLGADIGTTAYNALDDAVQAAFHNGIVVVAAAGNAGQDASTVTPAHAVEAITVGAYDVYNRFAPFSNYGPVVDLLAPGVDILSVVPNETGDGMALTQMSGTSMAAGHVSGAAALFLSQHPSASPDQVARGLQAASRATVQGAPAETTNRSVYVGQELTDLEVPPFFRYAVMAKDDILIRNKLNMYAEQQQSNANLFSNDEIVLGDANSYVEGFGYYGLNAYTSTLDASLTATFQPGYNPTGLSPVLKQDPIDVPYLDVQTLNQKATRTSATNVILNGHYDLGTRDNPVIWYVDGNIETGGEVTFSGYGVLIAKGDIRIMHPTMTKSGTAETTLGLYAGMLVDISPGTGEAALSAQIFSNQDVRIRGAMTLYGSITTGTRFEVDAPATIFYRPASPALTEPFWPLSSQ